MAAPRIQARFLDLGKWNNCHADCVQPDRQRTKICGVQAFAEGAGGGRRGGRAGDDGLWGRWLFVQFAPAGVRVLGAD